VTGLRSWTVRTAKKVAKSLEIKEFYDPQLANHVPAPLLNQLK